MRNKFLRIRSRHGTHNPLRRNRELLFRDKIIFRLGSSTNTNIEKEINSVESIKNSSDKFKMKNLFKEHGIKTSEFYHLNNIPENTFPLLGKKRFGSKGRGMVKIDNQEELEIFLEGDTRGYYLEKYFSGSREYRLHVSKLGCFYSCRKLRKNEATQRWYFNSNNCIWVTEKVKINTPEGEFIKFSEEDNPQFNKPHTWNDIVKECQKAIEVVGLDIGAVDVRVNKKGEFIILETNSAPSFGELTERLYIQHLKQLITNKYY